MNNDCQGGEAVVISMLMALALPQESPEVEALVAAGVRWRECAKSSASAITFAKPVQSDQNLAIVAAGLCAEERLPVEAIAIANAAKAKIATGNDVGPEIVIQRYSDIVVKAAKEEVVATRKLLPVKPHLP